MIAGAGSETWQRLDDAASFQVCPPGGARAVEEFHFFKAPDEQSQCELCKPPHHSRSRTTPVVHSFQRELSSKVVVAVQHYSSSVSWREVVKEEGQLVGTGPRLAEV